MSEPEVNIVLTINGKQYTAALKKAGEETDNFGDQAKDTAADIGGLAAQVKKSEKEADKLGKTSKKTEHRLFGFAKSINSTKANINQLSGAVKLLVGGFVGIQLGQVILDVKDTALQSEALGNKLRFAVGGSQEAAEAMNFVRDESNRLGLELSSQADAYGSIAAASKGTRLEGEATREIYLGVAEASAALSLTTDQSTGAMRALEQMMSKGTVQAEELRGQLGERIPGAFQIAARSMNVTTAELGKMLQRGEVMSDEFLPRFAAELRRTFGEDAIKNADSARASFNRLNTAFFELKSTLGEDLNETLSDTADWLTTLIEKTNELVGGGKDSSAGLNGWERQISDISERLKEAEAELSDEKSDRFSFNPFGPDFHERVAAAQAKVDAIANMMAEVNRNYNQFGRFNQSDSPQAENATVESVVDPAAVKSVDSLQQNLQRQIALYGQVGNAAKVRYETEHGALLGLKPQQKEKLIDMADELDFIKANDEAVREAIATQNEAIEVDRQLAAAKQEIVAANLQAIELNSATEAEAENARYQLALEQLQAAEDAKLNTLVGYDELRERLKIEHESRLTQIEMGASSQRLQIQQRVEAQVVQMRAATVNSAVALLSALGAKSKKFAATAILLEKATAIQRVLIQSKVAAMAALTPPPIGLGPVAGAGLAASITSAGYTSAGFITGLGAVQLAGLNSNSGAGASPVYSVDPSTGLPANVNPYTGSSAANNTGNNNSGGVTVIEAVGRDTDTITLAQMEQIWKMQTDAIERGDRILFRRSSAQGLELTESAA